MATCSERSSNEPNPATTTRSRVLVRASYPRLYGVANLILRDRDRAQDAVQDALVLAWRDIRALRDPDAWDAWLYRLTVRACYRAARTSRRRDVVELHVEPDRNRVGESDLDRVRLGPRRSWPRSSAACPSTSAP